MNLRTQEINELLGQAPNRLITWGITWFLLIIVSLLVIAAFIDYPEKLSGKVSIRIPAATAVDSPCYAMADFPVTLSGKLKKGLQAVIKLKNYSDQESGVLNGIIDSINPYPSNQICQVRIFIPKLYTSSHFRIPGTLRYLEGDVYAIIREQTLLQRFF